MSSRAERVHTGPGSTSSSSLTHLPPLSGDLQVVGVFTYVLQVQPGSGSFTVLLCRGGSPAGRGPSTGPYRGPSRGPYRGPSTGPYRGPSRGPYRGPSTGPYRGLSTGPYRGPSRGPYRGPSTGPYRGPSRGPYRGPSRGPYRGPSRGPLCSGFEYTAKPVFKRQRTVVEPPERSIQAARTIQKNNKETAERLAAESEETLTVNIALITPAAAPTVPPALPRSAPLTSYLGPLFLVAGIYLPDLRAFSSRNPVEDVLAAAAAASPGCAFTAQLVSHNGAAQRRTASGCCAVALANGGVAVCYSPVVSFRKQVPPKRVKVALLNNEDVGG
ncbi:hypothetical protein D4764_19G0007500 [Takifugu flavidus]|uniref:Uncharacterized protein n=1 Tax=Takifugu flavidus TaxID=433684 RepID=A0A5C6NMX8_9TELE|nr:hypothetical protein D4764_19G0007500 [Takifugu flavidus]